MCFHLLRSSYEDQALYLCLLPHKTFVSGHSALLGNVHSRGRVHHFTPATFATFPNEINSQLCHLQCEVFKLQRFDDVFRTYAEERGYTVCQGTSATRDKTETYLSWLGYKPGRNREDSRSCKRLVEAPNHILTNEHRECIAHLLGIDMDATARLLIS